MRFKEISVLRARDGTIDYAAYRASAAADRSRTRSRLVLKGLRVLRRALRRMLPEREAVREST